jgi:hypothetical protein
MVGFGIEGLSGWCGRVHGAEVSKELDFVRGEDFFCDFYIF